MSQTATETGRQLQSSVPSTKANNTKENPLSETPPRAMSRSEPEVHLNGYLIHRALALEEDDGNEMQDNIPAGDQIQKPLSINNIRALEEMIFEPRAAWYYYNLSHDRAIYPTKSVNISFILRRQCTQKQLGERSIDSILANGGY